MGGIGSTRWNLHARKYTVSECLTIDLTELRKSGVLSKHALRRGMSFSKIMRWSRNGELLASISLIINTTGKSEPPHIRLRYTNGAGQPVDELFVVSYQEMHFGGERAWLTCICGRRTKALHNPPESAVFRCRECHDLTYKSCQESHTGGLIRDSIKALNRIKRTHKLLNRSYPGSKRQIKLKQRLEREHAYLRRVEKLKAQAKHPEDLLQRAKR